MHSSTYEAGAVFASMRPDLQSGLSAKKLVIKGYKAQAELVLRQLETLVDTWSSDNESAVIEGVHLNLKTVAKWAAMYPNVTPFLVCSRATALSPASHAMFVLQRLACVHFWPETTHKCPHSSVYAQLMPYHAPTVGDMLACRSTL